VKDIELTMAKRNEIKMPTNPDVQYMQSWCTNFLRKGFGKNVVLVPANKPKPPPPVPQLFRINPMYQQPLSTRRRSSQNGLKELIPVPIPEEKPRLSTGRRSSQNGLKELIPVPIPEEKPRLSTGRRSHSRSSQIVHTRPSTERRSSSLNPMLLNTSGTPSPAGPRLSTGRRSSQNGLKELIPVPIPEEKPRLSTGRRSHSRSSQIVHARPSTERRSSQLNPMLLNTSGTPSPTGPRLSTERRSHSRSSQIVHTRPSTERRSRRMLRTNSNPMRTPS
jgi:hypothetical protein